MEKDNKNSSGSKLMGFLSFLKKGKNRIKSIFLLSCILILSYPFLNLLYIYGGTFFKSYSLEIDQYSNLIKRYSFEKKGEDKNFLSGFYHEDKEPFGEIKLEKVSLDGYYNSILEEYRLEEDTSLGDFYSSRFDLDSKNISSEQVPFTLEEELILLGKDASEVIADLGGLKIFHYFDDIYSEKEKSTNFKDSLSDKIVSKLDKEDKDSNYIDSYVDDKYFKNYSSVIEKELNETENDFYTSPNPNKVKTNALKEFKNVQIILNKETYYSYELIKVNLVSKNSLNLDDLKIYVKRKNYVFPNVGGKNDFFFKYKGNTIYTTIAMGYAPSPGEYTLLVKSLSNPSWPGIKKKFRMLRRKVPPLKKGFSVVNLEYTIPLNKVSLKGPYGKVGGYEKLVDWVSYMDNDAFWMLVAQTTGWSSLISPQSPWIKGGFENLKLLGPICKKKNIKLGAYVMAYFTPGNGKKKAKYDPSLGYSHQRGLEDSLHISLNSEQRLDDIVEVVKSFDKNPHVSFIGLDFIRTGRADGYEMGPEFIDDMNIRVPNYYFKMSYVDKIKWFSKRVENQKNRRMIRKWRWWKAHKVATIVNTIIKKAHLKKPFWIFTLGWEHGKQHGQDPYMFFDAGVFIDAVMLYEAKLKQFQNMMIQWPNYMRDHRNNIVIGNASDVRLLDGLSHNPAIEYLYRTKRGYKEIYRNSYAKGIFLHDISRALWSSKRGVDVEDWAVIHGHATSIYRHDLGLIPYIGEFSFNKDKQTGVIKLVNKSGKRINNISLKMVKSKHWRSLSHQGTNTFSLRPHEAKVISFKAIPHSKYKHKEILLGAYLKHSVYRKFFFFTHRSKRDLKPFISYVR